MFLNYLLTTLYSLKKSPGISAIKILSLAIGLGYSILVIMHVQYALSFDKHIPNWERTYRVVSSLGINGGVEIAQTSDPYAPQMRLDYPQIKYIANIRQANGIITRGEISINEEYFWAEPDIIDIFSLNFIRGNPDIALDEPNSVILNETIARKYFPEGDALGKTLTLENRANKIDLHVTGVFQDLPENTHLDLQTMISVETARRMFGADFMADDDWINFSGTITYLTASTTAEGEAINNDIEENFIERNIPDDESQFAEIAELKLYLQPLADIYLNPRFGADETNTTRAQVLVVLSVFAFLILLSSCINFSNLSVSQVQERRREIGIRKTLGADRIQILIQFLIESFILTILALIISAPVIYFAIPIYTNLTRTGFTLETAFQTGSVIIMLLFVIAVAFLSGLLPALAKSHLDPVQVMKGVNLRKKSSQYVRSFITVIQFGFSTALIILATGVIYQVNYLNTMDLGIDIKNLVILDSTYDSGGVEQFDYNAMFNDLKNHPGIVSIAKSNVAPPNLGSTNPWRLPHYGPDEFRIFSNFVVDTNYLDTMQIKLIAGRKFQPEFSTDFNYPDEDTESEEGNIRSIIISRFAARNFGFDSPEAALDEIILRGGSERSFRVIGVYEDFHLRGGMEDVRGSANLLRATLDPLSIFLIRIDPAQMQSVLDHIEIVWNRYRPGIPINQEFFEQVYNDLVNEQTNGIRIASIFASIITVLISIFGLYALAFYTSQRRTKEVGIRKVLGATSATIYRLLTWDFVKPVLISCVIACIVGYLAINKHLEQFSSRAEISPLIYLAVVTGTVLVAVLTVAIQSFNTAKSDPVKSLRYE